MEFRIFIELSLDNKTVVNDIVSCRRIVRATLLLDFRFVRGIFWAQVDPFKPRLPPNLLKLLFALGGIFLESFGERVCLIAYRDLVPCQSRPLSSSILPVDRLRTFASIDSSISLSP